MDETGPRVEGFHWFFDHLLLSLLICCRFRDCRTDRIPPGARVDASSAAGFRRFYGTNGFSLYIFLERSYLGMSWFCCLFIGRRHDTWIKQYCRSPFPRPVFFCDVLWRWINIVRCGVTRSLPACMLFYFRLMVFCGRSFHDSPFRRSISALLLDLYWKQENVSHRHKQSAVSSGRFTGSKSQGVGRWAPAAKLHSVFHPNFYPPTHCSAVRDLVRSSENSLHGYLPCTVEHLSCT